MGGVFPPGKQYSDKLVEESQNVKATNKSFEYVAKFKYS
jgi:hypothetical protein